MKKSNLLLMLALIFILTCCMFGCTHIPPESPEETTAAECAHVYGEASVVVTANCTREGVVKKTCTKCGAPVLDSVAKLEHTEVKDNAVAATCTATGLTEGKRCSVCFAVLVKQNIVPMIEHNYVDGVCKVCQKPNYSVGLNFTLNGDNTYYCVIGIGSCTDTNLIIPDSYNNLPVKEINYFAFMGCTNLTSVTIPDSVTIIGDSAFNGCTGLTNINIPDGITEIGTSAFNGCTGLISISIPKSVISIESQALFKCNNLLDITFDGTIYQWENIEKGIDWNSRTGDYTVHCTDGDIAKS